MGLIGIVLLVSVALSAAEPEVQFRLYPDAAYALARVLVGLGDKDRAMHFLEMAYNDRDPGMTLIKVDPEFDGLRSERRFQDLLRRMNFPQ